MMALPRLLKIEPKKRESREYIISLPFFHHLYVTQKRSDIGKAGAVALVPQRSNSFGTTVLEFALTAPILMFIILVSIQLAFMAIAVYDVKHVARQTARWLATTPDTTDADVLKYVQTNTLPGLDSKKVASVVMSPSCTSFTNGRCVNRSLGDVIVVAVSYNIANLYFLPTAFSLGSMTFSLPSNLATSRVSMVIE